MRLTRREAVAAISAASLGAVSACAPQAEPEASGFRVPDEGEPQARTWMALAHDEAIWGDDLIDGVRADQIRIANTIAGFQPVRMLVLPEDRAWAQRQVASSVELLDADFNDLWVRDTGPVFLVGKGSLKAVGLNFNGWGGKQKHKADARVAAQIAKEAGAPFTAANVVMEGGGLEFDGHGRALATESAIVNPNRNPGQTRPEIEAKLLEALSLKEMIWLPGIAGEDITDGHIDFYARFVPGGRILANLEQEQSSHDYQVTRMHLDMLKERFGSDKVLTVSPPAEVHPDFDDPDFGAGYINYSLANGLVIGPRFGDEQADGAAEEILKDLFPERKVMLVPINYLAAGGGGIHCATLHEPALPGLAA